MGTHDNNPVESTAVAIIEEQAESTVRRQLLEGVWYFSVIDLIALLTESPNPRRYWTDLKRDLATEGFSEVYALSVQLKMVAADGKKRLTDCANVQSLLRIIQSVPSPKAEPVKQWLAKVGAREVTAALGSATPAKEPRPKMPAEHAPALDWAAYHRAMAALFEKVAAVEDTVAEHTDQLDELHTRVGGIENGLRLLVERLGPATLSAEQLATVKSLAKRLHEKTGTGYAAIYSELNQHFQVSKLEQLPADRWAEVVDWFTGQIGPTEDLSSAK